MKLLKIENHQGYYLKNEEYLPLDKINKDDLLELVDLALKDSVELDEYCKDDIKNQAHQIIYKSIYEKLTDLNGRKDEFKDESERLFLTEYEKYNS